MNHRVAVFVSGNGGNMQALLDQMQHSQISLVVSSKAKCQAVARARRAGIASFYFSSAQTSWQQLAQTLKEFCITEVVLLGFMKVIGEDFFKHFPKPIFNLHPSLLPAFKGLHALEQSYEKEAAMGATLHRVIPALDAGPRVMQQRIGQKSLDKLSWAETKVQMAFAEKRLVRRWGDLRWN